MQRQQKNSRKLFASFVFIVLFSGWAYTQVLRVVTQLPAILSETSGIEETGQNKIWSFNDSGGEAALYLCDTLGNLVKTISVDGATNRDWEDITKDDQGNFYIGNIGNNSNAETDLTIFKIPNPDNVAGSSVTAEVISYSYEDQQAFPPPNGSLNFDCEALFWYNGNLYLSTKNRTVPFDGKTNLYRLPDAPGQYVAEKIGTFNTGGTTTLNYWITAGDMSPDGSKLCLLSSDKMWLFYDFAGDDFFGGQHIQVNLPSITQKEAVCFVSETELYITDEESIAGIGRNLYSINIQGIITSSEAIQPAENKLSIFPNPCRDWFVIEGDLPDHQIEIFDENGSKYLTLIPLAPKTPIPTDKLPNGVLFLKIKDRATGNIRIEKVVKTKY